VSERHTIPIRGLTSAKTSIFASGSPVHILMPQAVISRPDFPDISLKVRLDKVRLHKRSFSYGINR
jgi:hypothetical protein